MTRGLSVYPVLSILSVFVVVVVLVQVEPGKKVAAVIQSTDAGLRAQLQEERDVIALLAR